MTAALLPPSHVAIIMDGNGRWAQQHLLPRAFGHKAGRQAVDRVVTACARMGVRTLSLYAFSTENWRRPANEIKVLMNLIETALREESAKMQSNNIRLRVLGDRSQLSASLCQTIHEAEELTSTCTRMDVVLAINYSGQWALIETARHLMQATTNNPLLPQVLDEKLFTASRPMPDLPPVDLLIRSSGEVRLSNFHLWEMAYAELWFTDVLWPDFSEVELEAAFTAYQQRNRRFGALSQY
ncbi:MAG: polyprenyl diphosphate synthase [Cardiobacteriaceae bacterium]|nr:polyprenyl diphosphate synthase [Cardiobacteriaceae bacterium]